MVLAKIDFLRGVFEVFLICFSTFFSILYDSSSVLLTRKTLTIVFSLIGTRSLIEDPQKDKSNGETKMFFFSKPAKI